MATPIAVRRAPTSGTRLVPSKAGRRACIAAFACVLVAACASALRAQDLPEPSKGPAPLPAAPEQSWFLQLGLDVEYNTNVFYLSDTSLERWKEDHPGDHVSHRFDDMHTPYDTIFTGSMELRKDVAEVFGGDLRIEPAVRYLQYVNNPKKSHPEFELTLHDDLGPDTSLALNLEYDLKVFDTNYLADATDFRGSVSSSERRYEPGIYDEFSTAATYEQRLWSRTRDSASIWRALGVRRLNGSEMVGVGIRAYESPFGNRDYDWITARLRLETVLSDHWRARVGYRFERDESGHGREVMIRDEDDFNRDFNGDGDQIDQNMRAYERADRSRNEHIFDFRVTWDFAKDWSANIGGYYEVQDYLSQEPVDSSHRGRVDRRREARMGTDWRFLDRWRASLTAAISLERSNRNSDPGADGVHYYYRERYISLEVTRRF